MIIKECNSPIAFKYQKWESAYHNVLKLVSDSDPGKSKRSLFLTNYHNGNKEAMKSIVEQRMKERKKR